MLEKFNRSKPDFGPLAPKVVQTNTQAVIMVASGQAVVDGTKALRAAGSAAQVVTLSNNASSGFIKSLGDNARGVIVTQVFPYERSIAYGMVKEAQELAKTKGAGDISPAMLKHFEDRGLIVAPIFVQFVMGVLGGVAAEPEHLIHLKQTADRLFGDRYLFSVLAAGRRQMAMAAMAAGMGGHVRVGLEDNLFIAKGQLAKSNAEQVERVREIVERLGRSIATPDEARAMLGTKGADQVGF